MSRQRYIHIRMDKIPRKFPFPFRLKAFGFTSHSAPASYSYIYTDKIEFCVRLSSTEEFAEDELDGTPFRTPFPHVIVKSPGIPHKYEIHGERSGFHLMYSMPDFAKHTGDCFTKPPFLWEIALSPKIKKLAGELEKLARKSLDLYAADRIDLLSYELLVEIFKQRRENSETNSFYKTKMLEAASYLQCHYKEMTDIAVLAAGLGMSMRSFFRYWRKLFGDTPYSRILQLRFDEAKRLLEDSDASVYSIAETVGFQDSCYFIRLFRRHFSVTPARYRSAFLKEKHLKQQSPSD